MKLTLLDYINDELEQENTDLLTYLSRIVSIQQDTGQYELLDFLELVVSYSEQQEFYKEFEFDNENTKKELVR